MAQKIQYVCSECGETHPQWQGQCKACGQWNTLKAFRPASTPSATVKQRTAHYAGDQTSQVTKLGDVKGEHTQRIPTHLSELDVVLGGGVVPGSVVLIGGDPGIGKSTLLLQVASLLSAQQQTVLYVSGEESLSQIALRGQRMGLDVSTVNALAETDVEQLLQHASQLQPQFMVVDSIQTMLMPALNAAPGGVSQIRESAAVLTRFAKQHKVTVFLVGHVTKSGEVAGPRVLEHIVDTVLYFEGQTDSRYRRLRAIKNRFGAANELGVFAMTEHGLVPVKNPSAIFLSQQGDPKPGSITLGLWEGTRPLLVEIQALVDDNDYGTPRRLSLGQDQGRLAMLLAVLSRHGGVQLNGSDVYVNVVGGIKVLETSGDLPSLLAIASSLRNQVLPNGLLAFGEVGLSGEIRPVSHGQERLVEAKKQGFKYAIVPQANVPKQALADFNVIGVTQLPQALSALYELV